MTVEHLSVEHDSLHLAGAPLYLVQRRRWLAVNNDPQRRCYNGAHFSVETYWSDWEVLDCLPPQRVLSALKFWRELNDDAVKARGVENTLCEYTAVPHFPSAEELDSMG